MKPVMYHYVRPCAPGLPHLPYLSLGNFKSQLDHFAQEYGFVSRRAFIDWVEGGAAPEGVLLTFDDGLRDHVDFVLPALRRRDLFAIFYVSSAPVLTQSLLDVHKVHLTLGRIGGAAAFYWLKENAPQLIPPDVDSGPTHYAAQNSDRATKFVKDLFNWRLSAEDRGPLLDALLNHAFVGSLPLWNEFYLDAKELRALSDAGMGVGPHGHRHLVPSRLSAEEERADIETSCVFIEDTGSSLIWGFCYPYGAFTERTQAAVAKVGCPFALAVRAGEIEKPLRESARYALPRHNCNAFPHGTASFGGLNEAGSLSG
jgi:peptidoglycan/xylan/chitin deacetylase (PgdA/CDA1 family)